MQTEEVEANLEWEQAWLRGSWRLKALAILAEDWGSVLSTHMAAHSCL